MEILRKKLHLIQCTTYSKLKFQPRIFRVSSSFGLSVIQNFINTHLAVKQLHYANWYSGNNIVCAYCLTGDDVSTGTRWYELAGMRFFQGIAGESLCYFACTVSSHTHSDFWLLHVLHMYVYMYVCMCITTTSSGHGPPLKICARIGVQQVSKGTVFGTCCSNTLSVSN